MSNDQMRLQTLAQDNFRDWVEITPRIWDMNGTMQLQRNSHPTYIGKERIKNLINILHKEVDELDELIKTDDTTCAGESKVMIGVADLLGDLIVYCVSESIRWGIPLGSVVAKIMDSQNSKLVDGKPIPHPTEAGKFGKGPDYVAPEPAIRELLEKWHDTDTRTIDQIHTKSPF